jgi:hypothetical protein
MKHRNPFAVVVLSIITFGIYALVWQVKTKNEMNKLGAQIPTAWLIIIPFVNIWWLWKYSEGVEKVTNGKLSGILAFILQFLLSIVGMAIIQNEYNQVGGAPAPAAAADPAPMPNMTPQQPPAPAQSTMQSAPAASNAPQQAPGQSSNTPSSTPPSAPLAG